MDHLIAAVVQALTVILIVTIVRHVIRVMATVIIRVQIMIVRGIILTQVAWRVIPLTTGVTLHVFILHLMFFANLVIQVQAVMVLVITSVQTQMPQPSVILARNVITPPINVTTIARRIVMEVSIMPAMHVARQVRVMTPVHKIPMALHPMSVKLVLVTAPPPPVNPLVPQEITAH